MIAKIIRMVSQFGDTKIDSLMSWFPRNEKSEIIEKINSSKELSLIGDVVSLKKSNDINDMDLTKESIIQVIDKYNDKVEKDFIDLTSNPEKLKMDTIIKFLERRYFLEIFENEDGLYIFALLDKDTSLIKGYAVIVSKLTDEIYKKLDSIFNDETVFIYYIESNDYGECRTTKDFYIKSCEAILNEYMINYKLKFETIEIATIGILLGGKINE